MSIILIPNGNIFDSKFLALVNPTNCRGPMGKGLTLSFKNKFPGLEEQYKQKCKNNGVRPGDIVYVKMNNGIIVVNFPTKDDWKNPSKIEFLEKGLDTFINTYQKNGIVNVAFPLLGAGEGKIGRIVSQNLICDKLANLPIDIELYC